MKNIYLSLGSNHDNPSRRLEEAILLLKADPRFEIIKISRQYITTPEEDTDQPDFLNCVLHMRSAISPSDLLAATQAIERQMGRRKSRVNGPRCIDIDIVIAGEEIIDSPALQIPHPRMHLRRFVLVPLLEIDPDLCHPVSNHTVTEMLDMLSLDKPTRVEPVCQK